MNRVSGVRCRVEEVVVQEAWWRRGREERTYRARSGVQGIELGVSDKLLVGIEAQVAQDRLKHA